MKALAKMQTCELCRARHGEQLTWYSPAEWTALTGRTGWEGERDGQPVIAALLLPRRGIRQFSGMPRPMLVDWDEPAFACPWSPNVVPPILCHGPAYRTCSCRACVPVVRAEFKLDERGHFHRTSHCRGCHDAAREATGADIPTSYFVRPFADPNLPRVRVPDLVIR